MLNKITLQNVESHELTIMEFVERLNVITGETDAGKSGFIRGLISLLRGTPSPEDLRRTGADKVKMVAHLDDHVIGRLRQGTTNRYTLDKEDFEAVKQSIPDRIASVINMGDINFEQQLDPIFLMQVSSGDVARYFNKILGLDDIDILATNLASILRQTNRDIERTEKELEKSTQTCSQYDIYDTIAENLQELEDEANAIRDGENEVETLGRLVETYNETRKKMVSIPDVETGFFNDNIVALTLYFKKRNQGNPLLEKYLSYEKKLEKVEFDLEGLTKEYNNAIKIVCPSCGKPWGGKNSP